MTDAAAHPPILFPDSMDDLLAERMQTAELTLDADYKGWRDLGDLYARWADRLTARIAARAQ